MKVSKALEGFNILRSAEGASPNTIQAYRWRLEKLMLFLGDPEVEAITTEHLRSGSRPYAPIRSSPRHLALSPTED